MFLLSKWYKSSSGPYVFIIVIITISTKFKLINHQESPTLIVATPKKKRKKDRLFSLKIGHNKWPKSREIKTWPFGLTDRHNRKSLPLFSYISWFNAVVLMGLWPSNLNVPYTKEVVIKPFPKFLTTPSAKKSCS